MKRHPGLPPFIDALEPRAEATGPFARRPFLAAVTAMSGETPTTVSDGSSALVVVEVGDEIRLAGDPDLTDYHCSLGSEIKSVVEALVDEAAPGTRFRFDSLPEPCATELVDAFASSGLAAEASVHTMTAVVSLTDGYDAYLDAIGKKQRHEIRRKRRRYVGEIGELDHVSDGAGAWVREEFFRLHRQADGPKGRFMTPSRERLFRELMAQPGWRLDGLRVPGEDRLTACVFSHVDDEGVYLYNSCYDVTLREASPGVAMIGSMIERACEEGVERFDFLKGDEDYKLRLGAEPRPLYEVVAHR